MRAALTWKKNFLRDLREMLLEVGSYSMMVAQAARVWVKRPPSFSQLTYEINALGVQSFLIVFVAALSTGLVLAIQFGFGLERFGAKYYVPKIVSISCLTRGLYL